VKGTDLVLCLENLGSTPQTHTAQRLLGLIDEAGGGDNLGICLDMGHLHLTNGRGQTNQSLGEFIRLAGRYDNKCVNILSKPGLLLQKLTTKEPDDEQIKVGIASVEAVFNWKKYLNENFDAGYVLTEADEPHESDDLYTIRREDDPADGTTDAESSQNQNL
jgi:hypothetical protein